MVLIALFGAGLVAGFLRRGSLRNLACLRIRHIWLPLVAFALQGIFVIFTPDPTSMPTWLRIAVLQITYAAMFGFLLLNGRLPGRGLLLAGAALNAAVMLANRGFMPVTPEALARSGHSEYVVVQGEERFVGRSKDIVLEREETRLWPLSDVLGIPEPLPFASNFSVGDLMIGLGAGFLVYRGLTRPPTVGRNALENEKYPATLLAGEDRILRKERDDGDRRRAHDDWPGIDGPRVSGEPAQQPAPGRA